MLTHFGLLEPEAQVLEHDCGLKTQGLHQLQESARVGLLLEGVQQHIVQAVGVQLKVACQLCHQRDLHPYDCISS